MVWHPQIPFNSSANHEHDCQICVVKLIRSSKSNKQTSRIVDVSSLGKQMIKLMHLGWLLSYVFIFLCGFHASNAILFWQPSGSLQALPNGTLRVFKSIHKQLRSSVSWRANLSSKTLGTKLINWILPCISYEYYRIIVFTLQHEFVK